ncbi:putative ribonuclease H-like domain-containing protein [Tanacetum coccineum]
MLWLSFPCSNSGKNGNSWVPIPVTTPSETGTSTATKMTVPSTIEEKTCKKNDVKARSLLLMALPNEHQLTFDQYVDAQSMFAAIKARFGWNEATKKTQKALLKQQYENFSASSSESLDSIFNRLQRLVSRLAILGVVTPPEDLNVKFLRSLPSEWDTHVVVWMNKPDFDTMGLDDLYNNFKSWLAMVMKSAGANAIAPRSKDNRNWNQGSSTKAVKIEDASEKAMCVIDGAGFDWSDMAEEEIQANMALMAFSDSEYDDLLVKLSDTDFKAATYKRGLATLEGQIVKYREHEVLFSEEIALLKRSVGSKEYQMGLLRDELEKVKQEKEGFEFNIASLDLSAIGKQRLERKVFYPANHVREVEPKKVRENNDAPIIEDWVSDDEDDDELNPKVEKKTVIPTATKKEFVKPVKRSVRYAEMYRSQRPRGNQRNWNGQKSNQLGCNFVFNNKACFICGSFDHIQYSCPNQQRKRIVSGNNYNKKDNDYYSKTSHPSAHKHMAPRAVLMKTGDDSGCSRHMTGNIAHLSDFKDFDGGYVTFGGGAYGGRITGKAERKESVTLLRLLRTMLADSKLPTTFWAEAVSTACYVHNRVLIVKPHNKTPYELFRGFKPAIGFMKPFGCHVTILNTLDNLGKFDGKSDEENKPMIEGNGPKWLFDIDSLTQSMNYVPVVAGTFSNDFAGIQGVSESSTSSQQDQDCIVMPIWKDASYFGDDAPRSVADAQIQDKDRLQDENDATEKSHEDSSLKDNGEVSTTVPKVNTATPEDLVGPSHASEDTQVEDQEIELGNIPQSYAVPTTPHTRIHKDHPIEHEEPKRVSKALSDPTWVEAMQEELLQFKLQKVWILMDLPKCHRAIGTKWVYKNKKDERGIVIRNKARLVAQGHTQEEGIDYDEVFAHVARIEAIRMFLAYAFLFWYLWSTKWMYKMLSVGQIEEEVYVCQPPGFEDLDHPNKVYKTQKGISHLFKSMWMTLSLDIQEGIKVMSLRSLWKDKFQMSSMGELTFFLGLQVQQKKKSIFISQDKYVHEILRKYNYTDVKSASTPTDLEKPLVQDGDAADVDEHLYKSMIGSLMYFKHPGRYYVCSICLCSIFKKTSQDGITSIPNSEIFEQLALMGYHTDSDKLTFQKGAFSPQWRFLIHTILHCLSPKKTAWEQFSSNIATAVICLATNRRYNFTSVEGSLTLNELTTLVTKLSEKIGVLEDDLKKTKLTYSAAVTKLILRVKKLETKLKAGTARKRANLTFCLGQGHSVRICIRVAI